MSLVINAINAINTIFPKLVINIVAQRLIIVKFIKASAYVNNVINHIFQVSRI